MMANVNDIDASVYYMDGAYLVFSRFVTVIRDLVDQGGEREVSNVVSSLLERNDKVQGVSLDVPLSGDQVEARVFETVLSRT